MTFKEAMEGVYNGRDILVCEVIQVRGVKSTLRLLPLSKDFVVEMDSRMRTSLIVSSLSYAMLAEQALNEPEIALDSGLSFDGSEGKEGMERTREIAKHVSEAFGYFNKVWPLEARFAKRLVKSMEVAKACFRPDPMIEGHLSTPVLYPEGWGGNVLRLGPSEIMAGRLMCVVGSGNSFFADFSSCPEPEGAFISLGDFVLPPTYGQNREEDDT